MKLGRTNESMHHRSDSKLRSCQRCRIPLRKVVKVCTERIRQLEDNIIALGAEVLRPLSVQGETLLAEIRNGMAPGRSGEVASPAQDQNLFHSAQEANTAASPLGNALSGPFDDVPPATRNDEAVWDSGQDSSPQWPPTAARAEAPFNVDFEMPFLADYPMSVTDAFDWPWNESQADAFLQSVPAADPAFVEMPQDAINASSSSWDVLNDDVRASTDDDSENEIIEQLSLRLGDLFLVDDDTFRYLGATSNMTLAQNWSFRDVMAQQRPRKQSTDSATVPALDEVLDNHLEHLYFRWQNPFLHIVDREVFVDSRTRANMGQPNNFYSDALKYAMYSHRPVLV